MAVYWARREHGTCVLCGLRPGVPTKYTGAVGVHCDQCRALVTAQGDARRARIRPREAPETTEPLRPPPRPPRGPSAPARAVVAPAPALRTYVDWRTGRVLEVTWDGTA